MPNFHSPNRRTKQCTAHGTIWHGFKLPYGALYGISDGVPYVIVTRRNTGEGTPLKMFLLSGNEWVVYTKRLTYIEGCERPVSAIVFTIAEKCKAWAEKNNAHDALQTNSCCDKMAGVKTALPKERRVQSDYTYKYSGRYHAPAEMVGRDRNGNPVYIDRDSSIDKPVVNENCYWSTGKSTPVSSHKKPKPEKPVRKDDLRTLTVTTSDGHKEVYKSRLY